MYLKQYAYSARQVFVLLQVLSILLVTQVLLATADPLPGSPEDRASRHKFPRLANQLQHTRPDDAMLTAVAPWDLLIVDAEVVASKPAVLGPTGMLRTQNPDQVVLGYFSTADVIPTSADQVIVGGFINQLQNEWYFRDTAGAVVNLFLLPGGVWSHMLNLTTGVQQFMPNYVQQSVLATELMDGIFYDWVNSSISWLNYRDPNPNTSLDINNDGVADTDAQLDAQWVAGMSMMLQNSLHVFAPETVVVGNGGWRESTVFDPLLNGMMIEQFLAGESFDPVWYGWSGVMQSYSGHLASAQQPNFTLLMANRQNLSDTTFMRFALTSALLGNGYFCFTNGEYPQAEAYYRAWWYDEYAVDRISGQAAGPSLAYKGYLGMPLSDAYNPLLPTETLAATLTAGGTVAQSKPWRRDFEHGIALVNPTADAVTINLGGTYQKIQGTVDPIFNDGTAVDTLTLPARNGAILLNLPEEGTPSVSFEHAASRGSEQLTTVSLSVVLLNHSATQPVSIGYTVTGGTATRGVDYILADGTLTFAAGETHTTIPVTIVNDTEFEANETIEIILSTPAHAVLGPVTKHTYTILNDESDTVPPSPPQGLVATAVSTTQIDLAWTASTDNAGVKGYAIIRDGIFTGHVTTNLAYQDTGLTPNTLYEYTVVAYDAASNTSVPSSPASARTFPLDTAPPSVSITSPLTGATVSGSIAVTAQASDDVGVLGVQFYLDGVALGEELSSAPYSIIWDTRTSSNGEYTWTAVARDGAGRMTTSDPVQVTVDNDTIPPVLSVVSSGNITTTAATIRWTTNEPASSVVEYGQTASYGSSVQDGMLVTSHQLTLSGLTPSTLYHYRVGSRDAAGNLAASGDFTFTTATPPDTTAPTVAITSPLTGTTVVVRSRVLITASATDDVQVAQVQFFINDVLVGTDTTAPYTYAWNVPGAKGKTYRLRAIATDTAQNSRSSALVTVTAK